MNNCSLAFEYHVQKYVHEEMCPEASEFLDVQFADVARAFGALRRARHFRRAIHPGAAPRGGIRQARDRRRGGEPRTAAAGDALRSGRLAQNLTTMQTEQAAAISARLDRLPATRYDLETGVAAVAGRMLRVLRSFFHRVHRSRAGAQRDVSPTPRLRFSDLAGWPVLSPPHSPGFSSERFSSVSRRTARAAA